jgi:hypothetical protein
VKWLAAGLVAALVAAICSYVAVADNVQFGFWGWDRLPDRVSVAGRVYEHQGSCIGVDSPEQLVKRGTLWTVLGPRRKIVAGGERTPTESYVRVRDDCYAPYDLLGGP